MPPRELSAAFFSIILYLLSPCYLLPSPVGRKAGADGSAVGVSSCRCGGVAPRIRCGCRRANASSVLVRIVSVEIA